MVVFLLWRVTFIARERELAFASAIFWGAIGAALLAITVGTSLTQQMLTMMPAGMARGLQVILLAPIYEELGKLLVLPVLLLVLRRQSVRTLSGGIVLGMAIGTGFGVTENMFMLLGIANTQPEEELLATFWIRLLGTTPLHMTATAIPVALLGWSRGRGHDGFLQVLSCAGGLILGIGLHAIWNISVLAGNLAQPETVHAGLCIVMSSAFLLMVVLLMLGDAGRTEKVRALSRRVGAGLRAPAPGGAGDREKTDARGGDGRGGGAEASGGAVPVSAPSGLTGCGPGSGGVATNSVMMIVMKPST
jgi:RsiW-degrading membrane proteinase PrsW (M82 family)